MKMKMMLRFHLTLVRMVNTKKKTTNAGKDAGEKGPLHTVGRRQIVQPLCKSLWKFFSKTENRTTI
jgi:hypothetical protein